MIFFKDAFESYLKHFSDDDLNVSALARLCSRMDKLEDKFNQLNTASDERLEEFFTNSDYISDKVSDMVESHIDNIDWSNRLSGMSITIHGAEID